MTDPTTPLPRTPDPAHALFIAALRVEPTKRDSFLRKRCSDDEALRAEVVSLLSHHEAAEGFLDPGSRPFAGSEWSPLAPGAHIGRYRIAGILGAGGMGMVYLAEQDSPRRTVALKVIRPGLTSPSLLRRFEHEAQVLGLLQHPGIAQIFDAGAADAGAGPQPYFAMELVRGRPLTEAARALPLRASLELFARVCDAVQHAHAKGVIHRDLKPGNILVDDAATPPQPKVLDFGVARVTGEGAQASTFHTARGQLVGTLAYMSPEQVADGTHDADTRSDVYALGVILYELLSGRTPFDTANTSIPATIRAIREDDPAPLRSVDRVLAGDVETIAFKALEKDPARRYQTASEMAEDIRRYLRDEPILARRPTFTYRIRKFTRRNRALVAAASTATAALFIGLVATSLALVRANHQAFKARAINSVFARMIAGFEPTEARSLDRTLLSKILASAAEEADSESDPEVQGTVRSAIGRAYGRAGLAQSAEAQLGKAVELLSASLGSGHRDTEDALDELARAEQELGKTSAAESHFSEEIRERTAAFGEKDPDTIRAVNNLAVLYCDEKEYEKARPLAEQSLRLRREIRGENHRETLESLACMASILIGTNHPDLALPIYQNIYDIRTKLLGEDHPATLMALNNLAYLTEQAGDVDKALPMYERSLELTSRVMGADHPQTLGSVNNLASLYHRFKKDDRAEALYARLVESGAKAFGEGSEKYLGALHNYGALCLDEGKAEQAETLGARAVAGARQHLAANNWYTAAFLTQHAKALIALARYPEAERELVEARAVIDRSTNVAPPLIAKNAATLADLYTRWGKPDEAAKWQAPPPATGTPPQTASGSR